MLRFFSESKVVSPNDQDRYSESYVQVRDLPRSWKTYPSLDEGASYLMGWMTGYFAADGCVDKKGQAKVSSVSRDNLDFFRTVGHRVGVGTYEITERMYDAVLPNGREVKNRVVYEVGLVVSTVDSEFFLLSHHRARFDAARNTRVRQDRVQWKVVSIEDTDRVEEVYCAVVPETASFVLEGNILTGNSVIHQERVIEHPAWLAKA